MSAEFEKVSHVKLPEGLSLETFNEAARAISRWDDGQGELHELVLDLYRIFSVIEITPEMIRTGTRALHRCQGYQLEGDPGATVVEVFRAMIGKASDVQTS